MKIFIICGADNSALEGPMWVQQVYSDKEHAERVLQLLKRDAKKKNETTAYWITEKNLIEG